MSGNIDRIDNVIEVSGPLDDFHRFLSQIHTAIEKKGYQEVILDRSQCTSAFQNSMLSLCAQILAYRKAGIDFFLIPPDEKRLSNLFQNTSWAHYLDPRLYMLLSRNFGHTGVDTGLSCRVQPGLLACQEA